MFGMSGGGGGFGGLLAGLKQKGGDFLNGTTPVLQDTSGEGFMDERRGMIKPPISLQDTGQKTGGLLSKVRDPDSRGLTFADKLFAAGSVMQGDSGGAATYLSNQRNAADALNERDRSRGIAARGAKAFGNLVGDMPENFRRYVSEMGDDLDPKAAMEMRDAMRPSITPMSGPGGSLYGFNKDTGGFTQGVPGAAPKPTLINPDGTTNMSFLAAERALAKERAAGGREGAPLRPRAPPRGSPSSGRPAGY